MFPDRAALAQLAPRLARLAEETLFGDIWQRPPSRPASAA